MSHKPSMSAFGTKRTWPFALHMSAFGLRADIAPSEEWVLGCVQLPTRLPVVTCYDPTFAAWSSRGGACNGAISSKGLVAPQSSGRSRRARSRPIRCGESACSCNLVRAIRSHASRSRRFWKGCRNWAGAKAATRGSIREYVFSNINNNRGDQGGQNEILTLNASYRS